jgi:hypothetical protein
MCEWMPFDGLISSGRADVYEQSISPRRAECQVLQVGFLREAKRLLELECGKAALSTMQALLVMHSIECNRGKDRIGRPFHYQAVDMYKRLGYADNQPRPIGCDTSEIIQQEWRAVTRIIWATFCHNGFVSAAPASSPPTLTKVDLEDYLQFKRFSIRLRARHQNTPGGAVFSRYGGHGEA